MGNRILKESIKFSDEIDMLSPFAEISFYRLIVTVDDYGRYYADPKKLMHILFPTRDLELATMKAALRELVDAGLIEIYCYQDKWYLQVKTWDKHQIVRNKKSKFPGKNDVVSNCNQLNTDADEYEYTCMQMNSIANNCVSNPIQSNTIQNEYEYESNPDDDDEYQLHQIRDDHDSIFSLWKKCGFPLSERVMDQLVELYGKHGLDKLLESIKATADASPKGGVMQYLNKVLDNFGKPRPAKQEAPAKVVVAQQFTQRDYTPTDDYIESLIMGG